MERVSTTAEVLDAGREGIRTLKGHTFNIITLEKPDDIDHAVSLTKIISKLSPLVGNLIEHEVCSYLNKMPEFSEIGKWKRQDPDFPDAIFDSQIKPTPGFEIKAWFPLATEITARFKESQKYFLENNTDLVLLAWLPDHLFYGKPRLIDAICIPASEVAKSRDDHYHNPPDYLVLEPEDTTDRTRNLQQSCVNGHKFQGSSEELTGAKKLLETKGSSIHYYSIDLRYQEEMQELFNQYRYRLDTNFAKIDRIDNPSIEGFKERVLATEIEGKTIQEWGRIFSRASDEELEVILKGLLSL